MEAKRITLQMHARLGQRAANANSKSQWATLLERRLGATSNNFHFSRPDPFTTPSLRFARKIGGIRHANRSVLNHAFLAGVFSTSARAKYHSTSMIGFSKTAHCTISVRHSSSRPPARSRTAI